MRWVSPPEGPYWATLAFNLAFAWQGESSERTMTSSSFFLHKPTFFTPYWSQHLGRSTDLISRRRSVITVLRSYCLTQKPMPKATLEGTIWSVGPVPNHMEWHGHEHCATALIFLHPKHKWLGGFRTNLHSLESIYFLRYGGAKVTIYVYFYEVYYRLMQTRQQSG